MTLPITFKPKKNYDLARFGRDNDGGYLVSKKTILETDHLISFGILDDTSFESDFLKTNKVPIICFDHTINKSYWKKRFFNDIGAAIYNLNFKYIKNTFDRFFESKNFFKLSNVKLLNETVSNGYIKKIISKENFKKNLFFKIDIEGSEYRLLEELVEFQGIMCGLVIEFHDIDLHLEKINNFINSFNLTLTHVHPNNYGAVDSNGNPTVIELTFEKNPPEISGNPNFPNLLDQKCNPNSKDIVLKFD